MTPPFLGSHFDIARGCYIKPDVFCDALRLAAQSGYTHFLPYLENMIRLPSMEKACPSCAYTADDWRRFDTVANKAGIELVPHFNVIGHSELIAPSYPALCVANAPGHMELDVRRKTTRAWTLRCLDEFCRFSRSEYFLIGGDEWQPPRRLLARRDFDVAKTWVGQINLAVDFLARRGRRPIVWHDMLIHYPVALESLSRKAVIAFWFYDYDSDYPALATFKRHGFETLMASAVFDGGSPRLSRRSLDGLRCATAAVERHRCDGMIVTTWELTRWELQAANIPLAAEVIRGRRPASAIVGALTDVGAWIKLPAFSTLAVRLRDRALKRLDDPAWKRWPELRAVLRAQLRGQVARSVASYKRFHYPQGRIFDSLSKKPVAASVSERTNSPLAYAPGCQMPFGLEVEKHPKAGDVLRFTNGAESFVVYPQFGASLQDWRLGSDVIILEGMTRLLQRDALPGGYRSYAAAGGFRPIWALGTHSNPCILWQHPWRWRVAKQTRKNVMIELRLQLPHGSFLVRIGMERGRSGFSYEAGAINRLEHNYGAFNFNLPLPFTLEDVAALKLIGKGKPVTIASKSQSGFWLPVRGSLTVQRPAWTLQIEASPHQTAGYFVDWGIGFITPDLHGVYRKLKPGDETIARWRFSIRP
jgi:hypothetical protein